MARGISLEPADAAGVELYLLPRAAVGDRDRRRSPAKSEFLDREAVQRGVADLHLAALQQPPHLRQPYSVAEVRLDEAALGAAQLPVLAPRPAVVHAEPLDDGGDHRVEITSCSGLHRPGQLDVAPDC